MNREIKFRAISISEDLPHIEWSDIKRFKNLNKLITLKHREVLQYTGFKDCQGLDIYEGDKLNDIDTELEDDITLKDVAQQVYWCDKKGAWMLDNTFKQNKKSGDLLSEMLSQYKFKKL